jgi:hypothetical protein
MDPVLGFEAEVRKAQVNKKTVVAVSVDVEKAFYMMWNSSVA